MEFVGMSGGATTAATSTADASNDVMVIHEAGATIGEIYW